MKPSTAYDDTDGGSVALLEPVTKREVVLADALAAFAAFVLCDESQRCQQVIAKHLEREKTAGVLQGGSHEYDIYRLVLRDDDDDDDAAGNELLQTFVTSAAGKRYATVLTVPKVKAYMLGMCDRFSTIARRRRRRYTRLGNLMWILSYGPVPGQIRHVDDMNPNVQICLYISEDCPATVVYPTVSSGRDEEFDDDHDGSSLSSSPRHICDTTDLLYFWQTMRQHAVPRLLRHVMQQYGDVSLGSRTHTRYFAFWPTVNATLAAFGKLYQPLLEERQTPQGTTANTFVTPGTTLIAADNQVHAGPKTNAPRMFAFAIGTPEEQEKRYDDQNDNTMDRGRCEENQDNDGEVQYCPVILHLDLCCVLFSLLDWELEQHPDDTAPVNTDEERREAKRFLLQRLVELICDDGHFYDIPRRADAYDCLVLGCDAGDERRTRLRAWLRSLVRARLDDNTIRIESLMDDALEDSSMFHGFGPSGKPNSNKKKKKQARRGRLKQKSGAGGGC